MDLVWSSEQMGIDGFRYKWVLGGQGSSRLKMGLGRKVQGTDGFRWSRVRFRVVQGIG